MHHQRCTDLDAAVGQHTVKMLEVINCTEFTEHCTSPGIKKMQLLTEKSKTILKAQVFM